MSVLDELADYVAANSGGAFTVGVNLFKGIMPDTPETCIALLEYPGLGPLFKQDQAAPREERPRLQVLSRDPDYQVARQNAGTVWDVLAAIRNQTIGGTWYLKVTPLQSPFPVQRGPTDRDTLDRAVLMFNVEARKEPS